MYPNFENKADRASKHKALLERIARDQHLEKMKREAYSDAIWATDTDQTKLKESNSSSSKDQTTKFGAFSNIADTLVGSQGPAYVRALLDVYQAMGDGSNDKVKSSVFSSVADVYDAMGDASNEKQENTSMGNEDQDAPYHGIEAISEPMELDLEEKPEPVPDNSESYRSIIVDIFNDDPYLTGLPFKPVIMRDGEVQQHNYTIRHSDGHVINEKGKKVNANNRLLDDVDWKLTLWSIQDKLLRINRGAIRMSNALENITEQRMLFKKWKSTTDAMGPTFRSQLLAADDQEMTDINDMTPDERLEFNNWLAEQEGIAPDESKKRGLDDSTISLDTRVSKKGTQYADINNKAKVEYLYKNIETLESLEIHPYIIQGDGIERAKNLFLGKDMRFFTKKTGEEFPTDKTSAIVRKVNWEATLNLVIDELGNGVRVLNLLAGKEENAQKQANTYKWIKHILDVIKVVDPMQGQEQDDLSNFDPKSFITPARKGKRVSESISAAKKDNEVEKELVGRGLRGAGILKKNRSYNLADIEGSGKASDLKYKRIGTKFIRMADLNNNRLKLVFPNRTSVGPIRAMSDELTAMIKDLLYNDNINQQAYQALSIEDQRVFYEVIKKTHVQHTLNKPMVDPRLTLKAEFDKLRGEIALGNDNQDMLREMQKLSIDMYSQKMLSDKEFRKIMSAFV